jgi:peptide-methionine (S)-S-oxide reductase
MAAMATVYNKHMAKHELATLGGGCYWCLEAFYQRIDGIEKVTSGYSGGHVDNPTVNQVYDGDTGHAEVVQLEFDSAIITYHEILEIFYVMHDPTTLNRQGNDVGDEYRSVIFYHNGEQKKIAEEMTKTFAADLWKDPIVTQIVPYEKFWITEESMQDYYNRNPSAGYCTVIIDPKIRKLRLKFANKLKPGLD